MSPVLVLGYYEITGVDVTTFYKSYYMYAFKYSGESKHSPVWIRGIILNSGLHVTEKIVKEWTHTQL